MRWPRTANQVAKEQQIGGRGREHPPMPRPYVVDVDALLDQIARLTVENDELRRLHARALRQIEIEKAMRAEDRRR